MAKYIFKRILTAIPLIIVITILCFSLIHLAPYDAIDAMTTPKMSPEMVQMIREKYGYDQPVYPLAGRNPEWKLRLFYRDKNEYFR